MRPSRASLAVVLAGVMPLGCASTVAEESATAEAKEELTGQYQINSSCSADAQDYIRRAMRLGRIAAMSTGFKQCLNNLAVGTPNAAAPYYSVCNPSDPDVKLGTATQVKNLLKWSRTANPLTIGCNTSLGDEVAEAPLGSFKTTRESLTFSGWINKVVGQLGSQPADPYWPLSQIAGTIWHEVMHNYGYQHPSKCSDATYGPSYNYQANTIPYIVDGCMSVAVSGAGNACQNVHCPPDSEAMLKNLADTSAGCECIADPGTMNMETALFGNNGDLWEEGPAWAGDTGGKIVPGSSPSIAGLNDGNYIVAFQGYPNNNLWLSGPRNQWMQNTKLGMMQNTSPSVTGLFGYFPTDSYEVAFQANTGYLWLVGTAATGNTWYPVAAGTSPSIASQSDGSYEVAFEAPAASDGECYLSTLSSGSLGFGMKCGTSPSIAASATGGYYIAFQANYGGLWVIGIGGATGPSPTGQFMGNTSSPRVMGRSGGGYAVAYQDSNGSMSLYGGSTGAFTPYPSSKMRSGTSPAIAPLPNSGFQAVYQDSAGYLNYYGSAKTGKTSSYLNNSSSPAIAGLLVVP